MPHSLAFIQMYTLRLHVHTVGGGKEYTLHVHTSEAVDMNGRFQIQGGKNWFLLKEMNANRFFWDSHWLEIRSNHFCPSMGPNGGSVATDSGSGNGYTQHVYTAAKGGGDESDTLCTSMAAR